MDIIEKNIILKTLDTLLNYGEIEANSHTLIGNISSPGPFTLTILGDDEILVPLQHSVNFGVDTISVNFQFTTGFVSKFQLKLEGSGFDINIKLWKPYPISPVLSN